MARASVLRGGDRRALRTGRRCGGYPGDGAGGLDRPARQRFRRNDARSGGVSRVGEGERDPRVTAAIFVLLAMVAAWVFSGLLLLYALARRGLAGGEAWSYGLLLAWFILPLLLEYVISELIHPVLLDRYLLGALPPASMLAGVACSRLRSLPIALAAGVALIVMRAWVLVPSYGVTLENWREAVTAVVDDSRPHDCVAFFVSDAYMPLRLLPPPSDRYPSPSTGARAAGLELGVTDALRPRASVHTRQPHARCRCVLPAAVARLFARSRVPAGARRDPLPGQCLRGPSGAAPRDQTPPLRLSRRWGSRACRSRCTSGTRAQSRGLRDLGDRTPRPFGE
jgi:hypothetical protein